MPKQECMVELDKLPLVLSTESIESISLSGSYKLTSDSHNGLIARCRKTAPERPDLSLSGLFEEGKLKEGLPRKQSLHTGLVDGGSLLTQSPTTTQE